MTYSAIAVPAVAWRDIFDALKGWRRQINESDGILVTKELHATVFLAGRGRLGPRVVTKHRRSQIFFGAFKLLNRTEGISIFSTCRTDHPDWAFERLLNRINRTMKTWDSQCILFCDEGNEGKYTRLLPVRWPSIIQSRATTGLGQILAERHETSPQSGFLKTQSSRTLKSHILFRWPISARMPYSDAKNIWRRRIGTASTRHSMN